jgi:hypothetical protein
MNWTNKLTFKKFLEQLDLEKRLNPTANVPVAVPFVFILHLAVYVRFTSSPVITLNTFVFCPPVILR